MNQMKITDHICEVCGLKDTLHVRLRYGVVVCQACQKFFTRSHKDSFYLSFTCVRDNQCQILVTTRSECQACRFNKCIRLGMDLKKKVNQPELAPCKLCNQASSGLHFGVVTCEKCKSFFSRSARNSKFESYKCKNAKNCDLLVYNACQYCRYQKCLQVGMSLEAKKMGRQTNFLKRELDQASKKRTIQPVELEESTNKRFKNDPLNLIEYQVPSFNLTNYNLQSQQAADYNLNSFYELTNEAFIDSTSRISLPKYENNSNSNFTDRQSCTNNTFYDFPACLNFNFNIDLFQSFID